MATITRRSYIAPGTQIAASATAYVSAASNEVIAIDKVIVFNTNSTTETIKGYIHTTTPGASHQVFEVDVTTGVHSDITAAVNLTLNNSQILYLETTTATQVNVHISGRTIV